MSADLGLPLPLPVLLPPVRPKEAQAQLVRPGRRCNVRHKAAEGGDTVSLMARMRRLDDVEVEKRNSYETSPVKKTSRVKDDYNIWASDNDCTQSASSATGKERVLKGLPQ